MNTTIVPTRVLFPFACTATHKSLAGSVIWLVSIITLRAIQGDAFSWAAAMLLLATLVLVPLALDLVIELTRDRPVELLRHAQRWQLSAAVLLAVSFALPTGAISAALAMPWLGITVLVAIAGLVRLFGKASLAAHCANVAMIYLVVGGVGAVLSRAGMQPLGFDPIIIQLTGVHFHFAGFVLPIIAALLLDARPGRLASPTAVGTVIGVPCLAAGIIWSQLFTGERGPEVLAAWGLAAVVTLLGVQQFILATSARPKHAGLLLSISALSLVCGMATAAVYAWGRYRGIDVLTIPQMIPIHGTLNALGFSLCGLWGWTLLSPSPSGKGPACDELSRVG